MILNKFSEQSGTRSLMQQTLWNLAGQGVPLLVTFFTVPLLIHLLGPNRFGILSLSLAILNYFNLFDLGISLALTHELSKKLSNGQTEREISTLIWTTLFLLFALGSMGTVIAGFLIKPFLAILKCPSSLYFEAMTAFMLISYNIPLMLLNSGLKSILQATQRFDLINMSLIPTGILNALGSVFILTMTNNLNLVILYLITLNIFLFIFYLNSCFLILPFIKNQVKIELSVFRILIKFGGWMSISNLISPFLVYLDRFLIGIILSVAAISYYSTPYDLITKLWIIPGAVCLPLFALFSKTFTANSPETSNLFMKGLKFTFIIIFPLVLLIVLFAYEGLLLWVGKEFAGHSYKVLQWLSIGIFINSLAQVAFQLIIGSGRTDQTAKIHLIECPLYIITILILIKNAGIEGAAIAWVLRIIFETILLFNLAARLLHLKWIDIQHNFLILIGTFILILFSFNLHFLTHKIIYAFSVLVAFIPVVWFYVLTVEDRQYLKQLTTLKLKDY